MISATHSIRTSHSWQLPVSERNELMRRHTYSTIISQFGMSASGLDGGRTSALSGIELSLKFFESRAEKVGTRTLFLMHASKFESERSRRANEEEPSNMVRAPQHRTQTQKLVRSPRSRQRTKTENTGNSKKRTEGRKDTAAGRRREDSVGWTYM